MPASVPASADKALTTLVQRPPRDSVNVGLVSASPSFMVESLGQPRDSYSQDCQPVTCETLKKHTVTRTVGLFKVTGLDRAIDSLQEVLEQVCKEQPDVYKALGTAGMLCARHQRNSNTVISNHSWGTAVDLTLNGVLDRRGDNMVQVGMLLIVPIFNQHGWYWGGAFHVEDGMHFEAGRELIARWAAAIR